MKSRATGDGSKVYDISEGSGSVVTEGSKVKVHDVGIYFAA